MIEYLLRNKPLQKIRNVMKEKTIILFLDYDGTLAPFTENPSQAEPLAGINPVLNELSGKENIYLNIISGRTLRSLNSLINIPNTNYIGTHGLEMKIDKQYKHSAFFKQIMENYERVDDNLEMVLADENNILPKIRNYFDYLQTNHQGIKYEDKKYTITLHYPSNFNLKSINNYLEKIIKNTEFEVIRGRQVIEVRPNYWHKGETVKYILNNLLENYLDSENNNYLTIYIGDDTTDEDAFKTLSGINIYVQNEDDLDTSADYYLSNPKDVLRFLEIINDQT